MCSLPDTGLLFAVYPWVPGALCAWLQSVLQPECGDSVCPLSLSIREVFYQ